LQTLRAQQASAEPPHVVQMSTELQTVPEPSHVRDLQQCCPGLPHAPWQKPLLHDVASLQGATSPVQQALPDVPHAPPSVDPSGIDDSPLCTSIGV
jgi:hypothetical protein